MFFQYGRVEMDYLCRKDCRLKKIIGKMGVIHRTVEEDFFASVVHSIAGQQISMKAQETVWQRLLALTGQMDARHLLAHDLQELRNTGLSLRKAEYILDFAEKIASGGFMPSRLQQLEDVQAVRALTALKGVGVWTAEMILLFCLQRKNIFSFGDFGIRRGLMILYHHREMPRERFERYRRRFSPYGSIASFYLWAVNSCPEIAENDEVGGASVICS